MTLAIVHSRALDALRSPCVTVEVHLANGLPGVTLVGLADTEVKEARERVRAALQTSGLQWPANKRITVNLAPADLPKESGRFDLPIAIGILAASGQVDASRLDAFEFGGELSLAGELRPVRGALAMALAAAHEGRTPLRAMVLPAESAAQAARVAGVCVHAAGHLLDVVRALQPGDAAEPLPRACPQPEPDEAPWPDLRDVKGQAAAKRALEIAAAGGHGLLMIGPPGSGKSMLAQRFPALLPPLTHDEAMESAALLSLTAQGAGLRWGQRPFRAPHHSASAAALVGGGSPPCPGEISLAHHGVLFLDELPEYPRPALEALREPLETGRVTISRAARQSDFPARFQLIAAMNPCPCGQLGSSVHACRCSPDEAARYQGRLSGPLLDRIDLLVEVPAVPLAALALAPDGEPSAAIAARVAAARDRALQRQGVLNHALAGDALARHALLDSGGANLLESAAQRLGWSARGYHRALRVARSIADLAGSTSITLPQLAEAIQFRRVLALR